MKALRRLFFPGYRRGRNAEAQGDYAEAARNYLLAGEPALAAKMRLTEARLAATLDDKIAALQHATHCQANADTQRALAEALKDRAETEARSDAGKRRDLREAGALFAAVEQFRLAGECYEICGEVELAVQQFSLAGMPERVEALLSEGEQESSLRRQADSRLREADIAMQGGERQKARDALTGALAAEYDATVALRLRKLKESMTERRARIEVDGEVLWLMAPPITIGRSDLAEWNVDGASVSREHCRLALEGDAFTVEDLGSRNGTLVEGIAAPGAYKLTPPCSIALGDDAGFTAESIDGQPTALLLTVTRGFGRGERAICWEGRLPLDALAAADGERLNSGQLVFGDGGLQLVDAPGARLNGAAVSEAELIVGDTLTIGGHEIVVVGK